MRNILEPLRRAAKNLDTPNAQSAEANPLQILLERGLLALGYALIAALVATAVPVVMWILVTLWQVLLG